MSVEADINKRIWVIIDQLCECNPRNSVKYEKLSPPASDAFWIMTAIKYERYMLKLGVDCGWCGHYDVVEQECLLHRREI